MGSLPVTYNNYFCVSANVYGEAVHLEKNLIVGFCVFSCLQEDKHVFVSNSAGQTYKTKFVILAIPPHLTSK